MGVSEPAHGPELNSSSILPSESEFFLRSAARGAGIAALFLVFFGSAWLFLGLAALPRQFPWLYVILAVPPLWLLGAAIQRFRNTSGRVPQQYRRLKKRIGRQLGIVNAVQWTAISIVAAILGNTGRGNLIVPAIVTIVALHFIPLARVLHDSLYYWVCPVMMLWVVLCYLIPFSSPDIRSSATAIGTGLILWATSASDLWQTRRLPQGFEA
jgi:hypothetical protein